MNERIRELWDRAAESAAAYPSGANNSWETQVDFMDKFAQLIVRECCDIFVELRTRPADLAVKDVKKHFGVEE
jgi:hypothetical protein